MHRVSLKIDSKQRHYCHRCCAQHSSQEWENANATTYPSVCSLMFYYVNIPFVRLICLRKAMTCFPSSLRHYRLRVKHCIRTNSPFCAINSQRAKKLVGFVQVNQFCHPVRCFFMRNYESLYRNLLSLV